jgi:hypothetical protein
MFGTIRKHQTWLWAVIITLTIIAFVVFFSPYSQVNDARGDADHGTVSGKKVTRDDIAGAQREVMLRYFFMTGQFPNDDARRRGFDVAREAYQWLFLVRKQQELGIEVSADVAARIGRDMLSNFDRQGLSNPAAFEKQLLQPQGLSLKDFERFVRHYVGLQQLVALAGSSGKLVTPQEAKALYQRENQQMVTEAVLFSASNYVSKVEVTPQAIGDFYTNYLASYRVPDRVQVVYVKFPLSDFLAEAKAELSRSNLNEIVEANLQRMGTNYFGGAKNAEEAREKIIEEIVRPTALSNARRRANEFARTFYEADQPKIEDLVNAAQKQNLKVQTSAPFDRENGPEDMEVGADFVRSAFSRTPEDPFGQPHVGLDGVYVFGLSKRLASEIPPLEQIRDRVENDYKMTQAANLARQAGYVFHTTLTNGLAQGKGFAEMVKAAGVNSVELPPFSLATQSLPNDFDERVPLNMLKELAFATDAGTASPFQPTREGGVLVFVKNKLPVDDQKLSQEMPAFVNSLRRTRTEEAFQAWFRREAERGLRDIPLTREEGARGPGPGRS